MWGSYSNIPEATFYLLKGDYMSRVPGKVEGLGFRLWMPGYGGLGFGVYRV